MRTFCLALLLSGLPLLVGCGSSLKEGKRIADSALQQVETANSYSVTEVVEYYDEKMRPGVFSKTKMLAKLPSQFYLQTEDMAGHKQELYVNNDVAYALRLEETGDSSSSVRKYQLSDRDELDPRMLPDLGGSAAFQEYITEIKTLLGAHKWTYESSEKVDSIECQVISTRIADKGLLAKEDDLGLYLLDWQRAAPYDHVELKVWIGKSDSLVRRWSYRRFSEKEEKPVTEQTVTYEALVWGSEIPSSSFQCKDASPAKVADLTSYFLKDWEARKKVLTEQEESRQSLR